MFDDATDGVGIFDFEDLANQLLEQGLASSPSRIHGCLSGLLAAGASAEPELGLDLVSQALDLAVHGELAARIMELYSVTAAAMRDEAFDFHPLLPDDDVDISSRTEALADWCKGFLAGFAQVTASAGRPAEALSSDSSEILRDIAAIAEAGVDEEEPEEDSEGSYLELVEYLRFAVLNVFMDNAPDSGDDAHPPGVH